MRSDEGGSRLYLGAAGRWNGAGWGWAVGRGEAWQWMGACAGGTLGQGSKAVGLPLPADASWCCRCEHTGCGVMAVITHQHRFSCAWSDAAVHASPAKHSQGHNPSFLQRIQLVHTWGGVIEYWRSVVDTSVERAVATRPCIHCALAGRTKGSQPGQWKLPGRVGCRWCGGIWWYCEQMSIGD